jgi:16S rRNA (guanine966-N2)-methyltransferase
MRVIAGTLGGRRLVAPAGEATRPTTDRVREALFSILNGRGAIEGARVLDLYAGTGALGIEALSRGAVHATFVESARPALTALRQNLAALALGDRSEVVAGRVERLVRAAGAPPYDLVLADPPWADVSSAREAIAALVAKGHLAPGALVVLEHAARDREIAIAGLEEGDARAWGDTAVWMGRLR